MKTFISLGKLFQITLPSGWSHSYEDNIYTFYTAEIEGVLQISAAFHPEGKQFFVKDELARKQIEHPSAHITDLSEYKAVHFGLNFENELMLQYIWVTGNKNVRLLCTLTMSSDQESKNLDENYFKNVEVLNTLKMSPPTAHI